jgi:hypothetical protein
MTSPTKLNPSSPFCNQRPRGITTCLRFQRGPRSHSAHYIHGGSTFYKIRNDSHGIWGFTPIPDWSKRPWRAKGPIISAWISFFWITICRYLPKQTLTVFIHEFLPSDHLPSTALNFKCSGNDMRKFFLSHALQSLRPEGMVNFDESSWRVVMMGNRTVAGRGNETVSRFVNDDVKASFTFFISMKPDRTKVPLILIANSRMPEPQPIRCASGPPRRHLAQPNRVV